MIVPGSFVHVMDTEGLTAKQLSMHENDFDEFLIKVKGGEYAVVFDINDNHNDLVDCTFEDGLEFFGISKSRLQCIIED